MLCTSDHTESYVWVCACACIRLEWGGVIVFKIKLDLGLLILVISFPMIHSLSPQMLQAGFCCINTEQINHLAPALHVESCVVLVTVVPAKIFFYIPCLLLRAVPWHSDWVQFWANNSNNLKLLNNFKSLRRLITPLHSSATTMKEALDRYWGALSRQGLQFILLVTDYYTRISDK